MWHGTNDTIVDPSNATAIVDQWRDLHGVGDIDGKVETVAGHRREIWSDGLGRAVIEKYDVRGMGHGIPLGTRDNQACGTVGPHMLEAGICSTRQIAHSWGLVAEGVPRRVPAQDVVKLGAARAPSPPVTPPPPGQSDVGTVIEDALRAAGLMR